MYTSKLNQSFMFIYQRLELSVNQCEEAVSSLIKQGENIQNSDPSIPIPPELPTLQTELFYVQQLLSDRKAELHR